MRRSTAAVGSAVFFLLAPGMVGGLIPWLLTGGWQVREPLPYWAPVRVLGGVLLVAGLIALVGAFVRLYEEPTLTRRFGADYGAYRRAVPAWWPRLRPWEPGEREGPGAG